MDHETDSEVIDAIEYLSVGIEVLAVATIVVGTVAAVFALFTRRGDGRDAEGTQHGYEHYPESLVRTFLSWSLVVEIDHRWPWLQATTPDSNAAAAHRAW
jgi:hypothetical protein